MIINRIRKPISVTLDPDLRTRLDKWCEAQGVKVNRSQAIEAAIKSFLPEDPAAIDEGKE